MTRHINNLDVKQKTHLRDIFQIALILETQGKSFYKEFAKRSDNSEIRDIFLKFAHDEELHRRRIYNHIAKWYFHPISPDSLDRFDDEIKSRGIFLNYPENFNSREWLEYALEQELKMVDFYSSFAEDFTSSWRKGQLEKLISEEILHVKKLEKMLSET